MQVACEFIYLLPYFDLLASEKIILSPLETIIHFTYPWNGSYLVNFLLNFINGKVSQ